MIKVLFIQEWMFLKEGSVVRVALVAVEGSMAISQIYQLLSNQKTT
ncbi:MAG: hypothetical protein WBN69_15370 [Eudoraea sp.]